MVVFSGHQPNFLPYMGYLYKIFKSDVFVFDDDVQYSNDEYHNTNYIKVQDNKFKMTIPVSYNFGDKINEVKICYNRPWDRKLLSTIKMNYGRSKHFEEVYPIIEEALNRKFEYLVDLNMYLLCTIVEKFGLTTRLVVASKDVPTELTNNSRNVYQCTMLGGDVYYSGVGGKAYNDIDMYNKEGIEVVYSDYKPVVYHQQGKNFIENLSMLDYIFNEGFVIPEEWTKEVELEQGEENGARGKIRHICS